MGLQDKLLKYVWKLPAEFSHNFGMKAMRLGLFAPGPYIAPGGLIKLQQLERNLPNVTINNRLFLAAGFDKSAEVYNSLYKLGFGFVEVGTITPRRQLGNVKPRIFRLEKDGAMINRLGFNNDGLDVVSKRIASNLPKGVLGINMGPNKDTKKKEEDFLICLSKLYLHADYITINISSPNTEGLRDFHEYKSLSSLLIRLKKLKKPFHLRQILE